MTDSDDLTDLIHQYWAKSPADLARWLIDAGYRRVVVDDAMIERAHRHLDGVLSPSRGAVRAALTAALTPKDQPHEKAVGAPANWVHGYLPCGCRDDGQGRHVR